MTPEQAEEPGVPSYPECRHGKDPCPVCDGCGVETHEPGATVCLDCPGEPS